MGRGIGQRFDNLHLLDDRARPSVRDDERQRMLMFRTNVNEMNVQPIDLGDELWQGVQSRLHLPPVVFRPPIARECLHRRELHALRRIRDRFPFRPLGRADAPAQFGKFRFRNIDLKRTNSGLITARLLCTVTHSCAPFWKNKTGKTSRARSNGCRGSTAKAPAIEAARFFA